jgi:hypothetical protein
MDIKLNKTYINKKNKSERIKVVSIKKDEIEYYIIGSKDCFYKTDIERFKNKYKEEK